MGSFVYWVDVDVVGVYVVFVVGGWGVGCVLFGWVGLYWFCVGGLVGVWWWFECGYCYWMFVLYWFGLCVDWGVGSVFVVVWRWFVVLFVLMDVVGGC